MSLVGDWQDWQASQPRTLLAPEMDCEGVACPVEPSRRGSVHHPVHQLRDPYVFEEAGHIYLMYSVAGERGIGIGELMWR